MDSSAQLFEQEHITSLSGFLKDTLRLAIYAVESGQLPAEIHIDELYRMWDIKITHQKTLPEEDIIYLQSCYAILSRQLAPTTAISLRATETKNAKSSQDYMNTDAGRHVRNIWISSFLILAAIVFMNIYQYLFELDGAKVASLNADAFNTANYIYTFFIKLTPFMYGAFGACIYLLRQAETQLQERTFDPRRLPEFRNRLVLGTLSGGIIVMLYSSGGSETNVKITEAALGFIGGYSIDLLFSLLDRIVEALKPVKKTNSGTPRPPTESSANALQRNRRHTDKKGKGEKEPSPQVIPITKKEPETVV